MLSFVSIGLISLILAQSTEAAKVTVDTEAFWTGTSPTIGCPLEDTSKVIWSNVEEGLIAGYPGNTVLTGYQLSGPNLTIPNADSTDSDYYQCQNTDKPALPIYVIPVVIATKPASKMTTSYNNDLIPAGVTYNVTCTVPTSSPAATIKFYMRKKGATINAEIFSGVTNYLVAGDELSGSRAAQLQYAFYPDHNNYIFRCEAAVSVITNVDSVEFTPNVDSSTYKLGINSGIRLEGGSSTMAFGTLVFLALVAYLL